METSWKTNCPLAHFPLMWSCLNTNIIYIKIIANMFWLCKQQVKFIIVSEESIILSNFNYNVLSNIYFFHTALIRIPYGHLPCEERSQYIKKKYFFFQKTTQVKFSIAGLHLLPFSYNYYISCALCKMWKLCLPLHYNNVCMQSWGSQKYNVIWHWCARFMIKQ